ncbi:MAG: SRPBCC family protein [Acidimicrobiales bacterium]
MAGGHFTVEATAVAPPEIVFGILADIPRWHEWAGPLVRRSLLDRPGETDPMGAGAVRKLGSTPVWSYEEITAFEPPTHLAYELRAGLPLRNYRAEVHCDRRDGGGTTVRWEGQFAGSPPGMARFFVAVLRWIITGVAHRLVARADRMV